MKSVAAALYGEMRLLRMRVAQVARAIASVHIAQGFDARSSTKFDRHFVEANKMPEPTLYKALAPKFGLLPSNLLIPITSFYANIFAVGAWLPRIPDDPTRGYSYSPLEVLSLARDAVTGIVPALKQIEQLIGVPASEVVQAVDLGKAEDVIAWEEAEYRSMAD